MFAQQDPCQLVPYLHFGQQLLDSNSHHAGHAPPQPHGDFLKCILHRAQCASRRGDIIRPLLWNTYGGNKGYYYSHVVEKVHSRKSGLKRVKEF